MQTSKYTHHLRFQLNSGEFILHKYSFQSSNKRPHLAITFKNSLSAPCIDTVILLSAHVSFEKTDKLVNRGNLPQLYTIKNSHPILAIVLPIQLSSHANALIQPAVRNVGMYPSVYSIVQCLHELVYRRPSHSISTGLSSLLRHSWHCVGSMKVPHIWDLEMPLNSKM